MGHPPLIVFTDLDGTLLDHESYSYAPAEVALRRLRELDVPLVLASSKTAAELGRLRDRIGCNAYPAIVENGAGLLEPERARSAQTDSRSNDTTEAPSGSGPEQAADPYAQLLAAIDSTSPYLRCLFEGFSDLGPDGVADVTGLPPEDAALAAQRQFSEPGLFFGGPADLAEFLRALGKAGVHARRGGRFLTLSFGGTKADRMDEIAARYGNPPRVALGDAPNDVEMLEAADYGIVVANPHGAPLPPMTGEAAGLIRRTALPGPLGWNSAVLDLLFQLDL